MVMGGMAEYFNRHVENTLNPMDKIQVVPDTGILGSIDESKVRKVNRVPGVSDAYGLLWMPYDVEGMGLEYLSSMGMVLFAITPRLILISILFATLPGTISGGLPAYRAAKMNPMEAMKYG